MIASNRRNSQAAKEKWLAAGSAAGGETLDVAAGVMDEAPVEGRGIVRLPSLAGNHGCLPRPGVLVLVCNVLRYT
jgi:hypothetical protein